MIFSLLLLVAAIIIFFNFSKPMYESVQTIKKEQVKLQNFINSQKSTIAQVQKLIDSYQSDLELQNDQKALQLSLPIDSEVASALIQLSGLTSLNPGSNLNLQSISISDVTPKASKPASNQVSAQLSNQETALVKPINKISFEVSVTGSYLNFKNFLKTLETNIRLFDVESVSLTPFGKLSSGLYNYSVRVVAYYQGRT